MAYKILPASYLPYFNKKLCDRVTFFFILTLVVCTLLAQVALTTRIYAVTRKNTRIAIGFAIITASQLVLGVYVVVITTMEEAQPFPPIPLDAYRICVFTPHRALEIAYTSISLLYDSLAFLTILFFTTRLNQKIPGFKVPTILETIAEDATLYFLVIFTSHFVLEMTIIFGRGPAQLLPGPGIVVYLPVMVSRIMVSLRKAADSQHAGWSLGEQPENSAGSRGIEFTRPRTGEDELELLMPPEP